MKLTASHKVSRKAGMTLLELTVVILVLLSLISILFIGARAWKKGSDRAASILQIRNVQQAVRSYANMNGVNPNTTVATLQTDVFGPGKFIENDPTAGTHPAGGTYVFTIAAPTLKKYGFKAVYFIMTVTIGKKGKFVDYMTSDQIKQLSDAGNVIGSHTYDHKNFKKYQDKDWEEQLDKPTKKLEEITGKKMTEFAYPFGLWNAEGIPELKKRGFRMAFSLADKRDQNDPLFTVRRIIASGYWSPRTLHNSIVKSF